MTALEVSLPAPLPLEREELIVVEIVNGRARTKLVHLPARRSIEVGRGGATFDSYDFAPATWPSACREVESGYLYARAGLLADAPICPACTEGDGG